MSLGSLLGKVKKEKKEEEKASDKDELEQYLEDTDVPDFDDPILDWWKVKECKWPALAKMLGQAVLCGAGLVGWRRANLLGRRKDARRPAKVGQGHHPRALLICRLQH